MLDPTDWSPRSPSQRTSRQQTVGDHSQLRGDRFLSLTTQCAAEGHEWKIVSVEIVSQHEGAGQLRPLTEPFLKLRIVQAD